MEKELRQIASNCRKVVLYGPESTGKSTLAQQLASYYSTVCVPEFSRIYAEQQLLHNKTLTEADVLPIALGQMRLENELAPQANKVLICDTDLLETKVYSELYYGGIGNAALDKYAVENTYDIYFLSYIDIPWVADHLRDRPHQREAMFEAFENALITFKKPYIILKGDMETRFHSAKKYIDKLLNISL